jgi:transposase-like protein
VTKWQARESQAAHNFQWGFARPLEFYRFPAALWPHIRTTNLLERRFRTFRMYNGSVSKRSQRSFRVILTLSTVACLKITSSHNKMAKRP